MNPANAGGEPSLSYIAKIRLRLAARFVSRLLVRLPHDPSLLARMGLIELNLGRYDEAAQHLERSRDLLANDPMVHFNLGRAWEHLGKTQDALKSYRQAISLAPDFELALARRAALTEQLKDKSAKPAEQVNHKASAKGKKNRGQGRRTNS
mgnify:CR=1 FL=1